MIKKDCLNVCIDVCIDVSKSLRVFFDYDEKDYPPRHEYETFDEDKLETELLKRFKKENKKQLIDWFCDQLQDGKIKLKFCITDYDCFDCDTDNDYYYDLSEGK